MLDFCLLARGYDANIDTENRTIAGRGSNRNKTREEGRKHEVKYTRVERR